MKREINTKINIGPSKFKTSNLQTKHKHLRGIIHPSLISNFAQSKIKSHLSHLNINKPHNFIRNQTKSQFTILVQIMKAKLFEAWVVQRIELAKWRHQFRLFDPPSCNNLLIKVYILEYKTFVQICEQLFSNVDLTSCLSYFSWMPVWRKFVHLL